MARDTGLLTVGATAAALPVAGEDVERTAASPPALEIRDLARSFGGREVVTGLTTSAAAGERIAFWGPNGSGKTTVLRCISGTLTATRGTVLVDGHLAGTPAARLRTGCSLSQERSFYLRLTGRANLLFFARLRAGSGAQARRDVDAVVDELGLGDFAGGRVDRYSSGMLQQLGFARALLADPSLLLLDEPTRSLDAAARGRLWAAIDRRPGTAVVVATHLAEDLEHCGRRVDFPT